MSKPLAIGLIIFFVGIIALGIVFIAFRGNPTLITSPPDTGGSSFPQSGTKPQIPAAPGTLPSERDLIKITNGAVSGFTLTPTGVRFVEKATGHVFDASPDGQTQTKISNTTIPKTINVLWSSHINYAIMRYRENEEIKTASAEFTDAKTNGVLLPANILSFTHSPDRSRIFYTIPGSGDTVGIAANIDNTSQSQIMRLPNADFIAHWYGPREISFLTPPSAFAEGFLYRYNIDIGSFEKLLGGIPGLDILWSKNKTKILFSQANIGTGKSNLFILNIKTGATQDLETEGFAQKCAWKDDLLVYCAIPTTIQKGAYPDDWLKGVLSFDDRIWWIDTDTLEKTIVKTLPNIDISEIRISAEGDYLYFQNKKDGALWSLQLVD
ncbi:MAG: hypothetical protein Q8O83_04330 [bacterium]|nr:hypothetical protein [bacterium]